jgi:hypothetical protein
MMSAKINFIGGLGVPTAATLAASTLNETASLPVQQRSDFSGRPYL